jgi:GT2 family glycosyltransferase
MDLSIILINYNTRALTTACVQSIYQFTEKVSFEIIVVDNASTEIDPVHFVTLFPEIKLIRNPTNEGFAKGNNKGIQIATGEVILLLNSDTEVRDNSIGRAFHMLHDKSKISVITGKLIFPDGSIQHQCGRFPSIMRQLIELFRLQKLLSKKVREELFLGGFFDHERPVYPDWIWGTFFMFKRDVLTVFADKKLSETYFMYMEDMEWCYQIKKAGLKIYYDPSITIIHHSRASSSVFFGEDLNPLIRSNYKHLVIHQHGKLFSGLFFFLSKLIKISTGMFKKEIEA